MVLDQLYQHHHVTSPGNLLETQILRSYSRPVDSETLGAEPNNLF